MRYPKLLELPALLIVCLPTPGQVFIASTVAGAPEMLMPLGDGGPASSEFLIPSGIAVDTRSNLFLLESDRNRVRRVFPDSIISSVAGLKTGESGYSGDDGPGWKAKINGPGGIAVDGEGNLFIADTGNHRIRKAQAEGDITTIAGTGQAGFAGDGGPRSPHSSTLRAPLQPGPVVISMLPTRVMGASGGSRGMV